MGKNSKDSLGDRMKGYELCLDISLPRRLPLIIRVDGKAFHTFTRGLDRPFDARLSESMASAAKAFCEHASGCFLAYSQSDEITFVLYDDMNLNTQPWLGKVKRKLESISASVVTIGFIKTFCALDMVAYDIPKNYYGFDSRAFAVPNDDEVLNNLIWRQADATRNSIQMVGQAKFSHKQLQGKSCDDIQEMLFQEKGINWNDTPTRYKRGFCVYKKDGKWQVDEEIPVFTQDRGFIKNIIGDRFDGEE